MEGSRKAGTCNLPFSVCFEAFGAAWKKAAQPASFLQLKNINMLLCYRALRMYTRTRISVSAVLHVVGLCVGGVNGALQGPACVYHKH